MGVSVLKILRNKKYNNWQVCKSCGGRVIFIMPKWYEEILIGKMGTLECTNCGDKTIV